MEIKSDLQVAQKCDHDIAGSVLQRHGYNMPRPEADPSSQINTHIRRLVFYCKTHRNDLVGSMPSKNVVGWLCSG
jgi:hypothetical protein